jgi:hypothetical protein
MEATKVIMIEQGSLGFEVGGDPKWRGEFTLEQVDKFNIKIGREIIVHLLEIQDTFATVEFDENEKTTVPITKAAQNDELFSPESPAEADTPDMDETLRGSQA